MDSANSSSLQSSSGGGGGDDEFDSRTDPLSAFFLSSTTASAAVTLQQPPPPPPPPPPSSSSSRNHHFFDSLSCLYSTPLLPSLTTFSSPSPTAMASRAVRVGPSSVQPPDQLNNTAATTAPPRSSKKRSRASRHAPTTMLTTDTSNFRAMVQEFTGIPSPPFAPSPSTFARAFRSYSDPPPPASSFLLPRPFMQKVHTPSFTPISSTSSANTSAAVAATNTVSNATTTTGSSSSINPSSSNSYQLPLSALGLGSQSQPLLNIHNPTLTFQSVLQSSLHAKNILPTMSAHFDTRPHATQPAGYGLSELGLPMGLIASEGTHSIYAAVSGQEGGGDRARPRPIVTENYSDSQQRMSSCKLNYSGSSSSEFNVEKGTESVAATRGEGMVDSWLCSSD